MSVDALQSIRRDGAAAVATLATIPDINIRGEDGKCLLHEAIAYGNQSVIEPLLNLGIDVNAADSKGQTALHYASVYQNADAADQILSNGGDIALADDHGNTALWTAVFNARGNYGVVRVLLNHGGKQFAATKNRHGRSPLDFARQIGDNVLISMLE